MRRVKEPASTDVRSSIPRPVAIRSLLGGGWQLRPSCHEAALRYLVLSATTGLGPGGRRVPIGLYRLVVATLPRGPSPVFVSAALFLSPLLSSVPRSLVVAGGSGRAKRA